MGCDEYQEWVDAQPSKGFEDRAAEMLVAFHSLVWEDGEPHPIEEATEIERAIDAQLPYTRVFSNFNGVRYPLTKTVADAVCEEYEAQDADWHAQVTELEEAYRHIS